MKTTTSVCIALFFVGISVFACTDKKEPYKNDDFAITNVAVTHHTDLQMTVWEITVKGKAGHTTPIPVGQLDGAPVLAYVFPTTLKPTDVGFNDTEGIVALGLTSHPDFDDTPLWDENKDKIFDNDGIIWHPHWVVLVPDDRVEGGLAVKQFKKGDTSVILPLTNPGMPMYMDSPGYQVITTGNTIKVMIPDYRIGTTTFSYDGVTSLMKVNTSIEDKPLLGVYEVYGVASGDLSLPYKVTQN
ncbi:hypothetical protein GCM10011344_02010 [Dokdonia pacifica]|uniref:Lipoprotein n=1 Tax=Dokdonia pacifica TaxID=1627892 RepID=A0A238ZB10_9FLAO|nr:hypothetical protein [Dokdonia pacifica]GGG05216.1 hypothetical protein GCM10011344_02010 [Dokdonia pacifica]SNR80158.1 hypothetical protein SAMN06265376_10361 [Dokdonia pacifica]